MSSGACTAVTTQRCRRRLRSLYDKVDRYTHPVTRGGAHPNFYLFLPAELFPKIKMVQLRAVRPAAVRNTTNGQYVHIDVPTHGPLGRGARQTENGECSPFRFLAPVDFLDKLFWPIQENYSTYQRRAAAI